MRFGAVFYFQHLFQRIFFIPLFCFFFMVFFLKIYIIFKTFFFFFFFFFFGVKPYFVTFMKHHRILLTNIHIDWGWVILKFWGWVYIQVICGADSPCTVHVVKDALAISYNCVPTIMQSFAVKCFHLFKDTRWYRLYFESLLLQRILKISADLLCLNKANNIFFIRNKYFSISAWFFSSTNVKYF